MRPALLSILFILNLPLLGFAADVAPESKSFFIGHNMTPSTETLKAGVWTVGSYAIAVGLTDELFVATSPAIWAGYNTANIHLKWTKALDERSRTGFFLSYFESFDAPAIVQGIGGPRSREGQSANQNVTTNSSSSAADRYQWKNISLHGLYSYRFDSGSTTYLSLKYSYFWNDDTPYSIRMDPGSDDVPAQMDFTTLTKIPLQKQNFSLNLEGGILGANYPAPYAHFGTSLEYDGSSWLVQLGTSYTVQFRELGHDSAWTPGRYEGRVHIAKVDGRSYYFRYLQTAMHPEIQFQYFF